VDINWQQISKISWKYSLSENIAKSVLGELFLTHIVDDLVHGVGLCILWRVWHCDFSCIVCYICLAVFCYVSVRVCSYTSCSIL